MPKWPADWIAHSHIMSVTERPQPGNPLQHIQAAAGNLTRDVGHAWEQATRNLQHGVEGLGRTLSHVAQLPARAMQRHGIGMHVQPLLPGVAVRLAHFDVLISAAIPMLTICCLYCLCLNRTHASIQLEGLHTILSARTAIGPNMLPTATTSSPRPRDESQADKYVDTVQCWCTQSLSLNGPRRAQGSSNSPSALAAEAQRPQPVFDVAYNPEDIKARLSGVPVYAVINKKDEFVLIAGDAVRSRLRKHLL